MPNIICIYSYELLTWKRKYYSRAAAKCYDLHRSYVPYAVKSIIYIFMWKLFNFDLYIDSIEFIYLLFFWIFLLWKYSKYWILNVPEIIAVITHGFLLYYCIVLWYMGFLSSANVIYSEEFERMFATVT